MVVATNNSHASDNANRYRQSVGGGVSNIDRKTGEYHIGI